MSTTSNVHRLLENATFQRMAARKSRLSLFCTILMLIVYFGYIGIIAWAPQLFSTPVSPGETTTWGIYSGLFVILFSIAITGVYVHKANGEFDRLTREAISEIGEDLS